MAALTFYPTFDGGNMGQSPGGSETTSATGWTVAKTAPTVYSRESLGTERAASTFAATAEPSGTPNLATLTDGEVTDPLSGTFSAGVWTATLKVIAVTSGGDQDGNLRFRIWKCNATLTTFTELTSGVIDGGTVTNLATTLAQTSAGATASIGPFTLTNECIYLQLAWKITGAGGATNRDVLLRKGPGITLVTPNFTATAAGTTYTEAGHGVEHG